MSFLKISEVPWGGVPHFLVLLDDFFIEFVHLDATTRALGIRADRMVGITIRAAKAAPANAHWPGRTRLEAYEFADEFYHDLSKYTFTRLLGAKSMLRVMVGTTR